MNDILIFGPYCGDWETEITLFRPYIKWISSVVGHEDIYISTHSNRAFIYDWIDQKNVIPVYGDLSRDELSQKNVINTNLTQKDYFIIQKRMIHQIASKYKKEKRVLHNFYLNYTARIIHYPYYKRIFGSLQFDGTGGKNNIVYIPDISESKERSEKIYEFLTKWYDVTVVGDMKTHLPEENVVLKRIDYFENGYRSIMELMSQASMVVCPLSHWTFVCRVQKIPVLSWITKRNSKYLGLENFKNKNCVILNDNNIKTVLESVKISIERRT